MSHDVFISHSNKDKAVADAVCAMLEQQKVRCWVAPRDVTPGKEWGEAIIDAITGSRVMVLIFSSSANDSPQIRREVERAVNKGVIIVPFRIEDVLPTKSLEYFIGSVHWLDALTPPIEHHLERLAVNVRKIVSDDAPQIPEPNSLARESKPIPAGTLPTVGVESIAAHGLQKPAEELEAEGTSGKAIGSLVCGLLFVLFPAAIGAIVLGHMARGEIRRSGGRLKGGKLAIAGLVLGYAGVAAVPLALFMAILIPNIMYSRIEANETAAIGSLRTLNTAIMTYELTYGHYPASLAVLGPPDKLLDYEGRELPAKATPSEKGADVIEAVLAGGEKSGYKFSYHLDGKSDPKAYSVSADPINAPKTGRRFFLLDEFGVIHASDSGPATAASPPIQ